MAGAYEIVAAVDTALGAPADFVAWVREYPTAVFYTCSADYCPLAQWLTAIAPPESLPQGLTSVRVRVQRGFAQVGVANGEVYELDLPFWARTVEQRVDAWANQATWPIDSGTVLALVADVEAA